MPSAQALHGLASRLEPAKGRSREVTAADGFGIAGVGVAFAIVLVAVGASVCLVLRGDRDEEEEEESGGEKTE
jgi:hypothetical protein